MTWITELFRSAMFKKMVMAVTGLMLFGFVLGHMVGNMKLYQGAYEDGPHAGRYKIDVYAEGLRELGAPVLGHEEALWLARLGLLAAVGLHILSAWQVSRLSQKARPQTYAAYQPQASTYASRTMRWGGVILVLFIIYHLLHLTLGVQGLPGTEGFEHGAVYENVVRGFQDPLVAGFYIIANLALGLHLSHGLWSLFQSLGLNGARFNAARKLFAQAFAVLITLGNISFPIAVLTGIVQLGAS